MFLSKIHQRFLKNLKTTMQIVGKRRNISFDEACMITFDQTKNKLIEAPIVVAPNWDKPFKIMCNASDYAVGAVLRQRRENIFRPIYYASKTLNETQENYATTDKEMLAMVYSCDKFRTYILGSK